VHPCEIADHILVGRARVGGGVTLPEKYDEDTNLEKREAVRL